MESLYHDPQPQPFDHLAQLHTLCKLLPQSFTEIAERVGMNKSNLVAALVGRRPMPASAYEALLELAGLGSGIPDTQRVHFWVVTPRAGSLNDLEKMLPLFFPQGGEVAIVLPQGMGPQDLRRMDHVWAITDGSVRLVVRRTFLSLFDLTPWAIEERLPAVKVKGGGWQQGGMLHVARYGDWQQGDVSLQQFDATWAGQPLPEPEYSWQDVARLAMEQGLSPNDLVRWLRGNAKRNPGGKTGPGMDSDHSGHSG